MGVLKPWEKIVSPSGLLRLFQFKNPFVQKEFDVFISYAVEDKIEVTNELNERLRDIGLRTWYAGNELSVGDSISGTIMKGLAKSNFGIIVLSRNFFSKDWPRQELAVLRSKKMQIFPVWHGMSMKEIEDFDPELADIWGVSTEIGIDKVAEKLATKIMDTTIKKKKNGKRQMQLLWLMALAACAAIVGLIIYEPNKKVRGSEELAGYPCNGEDHINRIGAICKDGTRSNATRSGACSGHGGVEVWLCE